MDRMSFRRPGFGSRFQRKDNESVHLFLLAILTSYTGIEIRLLHRVFKRGRKKNNAPRVVGEVVLDVVVVVVV